MNLLNLLAANNGMGLDAWIKLGVGAVVLIFAIAKQIMEANKQAGKRAAAQGAAPKPAPAAGGQQADPLRSQVEEFLRRASQKQDGQPQQRPANEIELLVDDSGRQPQRPRKPAPLVSDKRPARRSVTPKRRVTLAERAAAREEKRVGHLTEQQPQLGQRIVQEDKQFDQQLKAKFDHQVGTLTGTLTATDPIPLTPVVPSTASQIAAMLASPDGVRQAVLLNEIMNRPADRW